MSIIERECVVGRCTSVQHGGQLTAAATMRTGDNLLAAYMRWLCGTCSHVADSAGRTALHMASSCGHGALVRWLVRRADANIDVRDVESGYTALHRSIFYGQIHIAADLIKMGASLSVKDRDGLTPIDHAMKDRPAVVEFNGKDLCEAYVWGTNNNYSLGTGNQQSRSQPEMLDMFRKQGISIKQVAMHKFHSVFVSHDGRVFSCGHGQGGRLGLGTESAALTPCAIRMQSSGTSIDASALACTAACVGRDHTIFLMENGTVWSCGLNTYHQLGHSPPPPKLLVPRQLTPRCIHAAGDSVIGICATRFHTVIWGQKAVLTFGLHAGQLGHTKGPNPTIMLPRQVSALSHKPGKILKVSASDGATVVAVERGIAAGGTSTAPGADIYVLHEFKCQKIATRQVGVVQIAVVGGHLDTAVVQHDEQSNARNREEEQKLRVFVLNNRGHLLLWQENATKELIRCVFSLNRPLYLTGITVQTRGQMLFITRDGEAFEGEAKERLGAETSTVRVKRLPHIHRAVAVTSDPKGRNFAIVQAHPIVSLLEVPQMESSQMRQHMSGLLEEASEDDIIHDVVFKVGSTRFPAHQYIIASRCEVLSKRIERESGKAAIPIIEIKDMRPDIFKQMLQFIYTNHCSFLEPGECPVKVMLPDEKDNKNSSSEEIDILDVEDNNLVSAFEVYSKKREQASNKAINTKQKTSNFTSPVRMMHEAAKILGLSVLSTELEKVRYEDGRTIVKQGCHLSRLNAPVLSRLEHPQLYDVKIHSEEKKQIQAHKCVLVSRLEYFHSMLTGRWVETSGSSGCELNLPLPINVLEVLLDFLYTDSAPSVEEWEDLEFVSNVLVVADQLFIARLKEAAEVALANMLTLRNVGQILQLSGTYNAQQLKQCCLQYITLNLPAVLEARLLESVSKDLLEDLTRYYCDFLPAMSRRIITPYSIAPSEELLQAVNDAHPISPWDNEDDVNTSDEDFALIRKGLKSAKKKIRTRKSSTGENGATNKNSRVRNESVGSNNSWGDEASEEQSNLDIDELTERPANTFEDISLILSACPSSPPKGESPWVKILNNHDKHQRIVLSRLKAASTAKEIATSPMQESFTRLVPQSRQQQGRSLVETPPIVVPLGSNEFPELQKSSPPLHQDHSKTRDQKLVDVKKVTKLSQKQRKKLAAEQQVGSPVQSTIEPVQPAWGKVTGSERTIDQTFSFLEIMKMEMQQIKQPVSPPSHRDKDCQSPPSHLSSSPGQGPNPWLRGVENTRKVPHHSSTNSSAVNFSDIVADEKKQRENWARMRAKPLQLTQLEDQAIEDLLVFYNAAGVTDENITVKRVLSGTVAPPTWITSHH